MYVTCVLSTNIDDENLRNTTTEFIYRANYGLRNSNFGFDVRDRDICETV